MQTIYTFKPSEEPSNLFQRSGLVIFLLKISMKRYVVYFHRAYVTDSLHPIQQNTSSTRKFDVLFLRCSLSCSDLAAFLCLINYIFLVFILLHILVMGLLQRFLVLPTRQYNRLALYQPVAFSTEHLLSIGSPFAHSYLVILHPCLCFHSLLTSLSYTTQLL